jgi:FANCI helical domain 1
MVQIFELLKTAIIKSYRDAERQRSSHWVADIVSDQRVAAAEQILDTIKNRFNVFHHI